jgi:sulfotransferase family protein
MLEVIGTGFGRTGTLSLKAALERLGFGPCHHMLELMGDAGQIAQWTRVARGETADWDAVYRGYRATVDWPGARYWRELTAHFPQAKVILTVRDPWRWYESAAASIFGSASGPAPADPDLARLRQITRDIVWDGEFAGRFADERHAIEVFTGHNRAVRREIPADRLLVYEVTQGWEPLCAFLGAPVPDEPFPRMNDRREFAERRRRLDAGG